MAFSNFANQWGKKDLRFSKRDSRWISLRVIICECLRQAIEKK